MSSEVRNRNGIYIRSKSGQLYSFGSSKTQRFKTPTPHYVTEFKGDNDKFSTFSSTFYTPRRSTGFGYGNKSDLARGMSQGKQAPGQYQIDSKFNTNKRHGYGYNFGIGRAKYKNVLTNNMSADKMVPGPGQYTPSHNLVETKLHYTLRPQTKQNVSKNNNPGPGTYSMEKASIDPKGNYTLSKFKSSGATRFNPPRGAVSSSGGHVPGPGQYDHYNSLNNSGTYGCSKYGNSLVRSFGKSERKGISNSRNNSPGPGSYDADSTFVGPELPGYSRILSRSLNTTRRSASVERF